MAPKLLGNVQLVFDGMVFLSLPDAFSAEGSLEGSDRRFHVRGPWWLWCSSWPWFLAFRLLALRFAACTKFFQPSNVFLDKLFVAWGEAARRGCFRCHSSQQQFAMP